MKKLLMGAAFAVASIAAVPMVASAQGVELRVGGPRPGIVVRDHHRDRDRDMRRCRVERTTVYRHGRRITEERRVCRDRDRGYRR
jgi:hypothetical protein